jgi:hypothetical protein
VVVVLSDGYTDQTTFGLDATFIFVTRLMSVVVIVPQASVQSLLARLVQVTFLSARDIRSGSRDAREAEVSAE